MIYQDTAIWRNSLAPRRGDAYARQRQSLRAAYDRFWENGCELARQIQKDLPSLTLHDERHFDALWARADQILGDADPLTPLEAFVLGGAILLHDAGNCVAAYPGRMDEIENTNDWKDEISSVDVQALDTEEARHEARTAALLRTLRRLHAKRAEDLAELTFVNPTTNTLSSIIEDGTLRNHLGRTIGLVAASHHWSIQDLPRKLSKVIGASVGAPAAWSVRPIRVACLLRCADATQLDQSRAPDFLFALLQLKGLSELHWRAQNRLLAPVVDPDDSSALIFTSSRDFSADDAEAWWLAYDAIQVANRELQDSFSLLRDLRQKPFSIIRVRDSDSPERLASHVVARGWRPVSAEVKVSNVENVVRMFGGEELYGHDLLVPLRELLQNAADAIARRREMPQEIGYTGEISVKLADANAEYVDLEVWDDGIGMSEEALTGPLIDFGTSYLGSALAKEERPGMAARTSKRLGRYGIGFFSAFMLSEQVSVTSRPFDSAVSEFRTLSFRNGFSLRPLLLSASVDYGARISTVARLRVKKSVVHDLLRVRVSWNNDVDIALSDAVALCCPMLDCDVYVEEAGTRQLAHSRRWHEGDLEQWCRATCLMTARGDRRAEDAIAKVSANLELIDEKDPALGCASISVARGAVGMKTVGGLKVTAPLHSGVFEEKFVGCIDFVPRGPQRRDESARKPLQLAAWASRQAQRLAQQNLSPMESHLAAVRVSEFGGDPTELIRMRLRGSVVGLAELADAVEGGPVAAVVEARDDDTWLYSRISLPSGHWNGPSDEELEFRWPVMEFPVDKYLAFGSFYKLSSALQYTKNSFTDCLGRMLRSRGFDLELKLEKDVDVAEYVGLDSERDSLTRGMIVKNPAVILSASRLQVS